jgi:putative SOS response-associated peptidase YedK
LINARSETVTVKPAFRAAAQRRRAIVPASGYFEWQAHPTGPKTPYYLTSEEGNPLGFAALYEWWRPASSADVDWLVSVTIITRSATDAVGHVHDRMPVVVPRSLLDAWLDPGLTGRADVAALLASIPDPVLVPREVSRAVNSVRSNSPELVKPLHRST